MHENLQDDGSPAMDTAHRHHVAVWVDLVCGNALAFLVGLLIGVLLIPGDGNPGHIFSVAVCGFCGLILWGLHKTSLPASIALCIVVILVTWPIAIALRDATGLMLDISASQSILRWLCWLLPAALFVVGLVRWMAAHSWVALVVAVIPFTVQIGYITFRSPLTAQIDRIEGCGIMVTGTQADGYGIAIIHDKTDAVIQAAYEELKGLPGLRHTHIQSKRITDGGIALLSKLPEIESARLDSVSISRKGLECSAQMPHLRRLWLSHVPCTDEDIAALSGSQSLQGLVIADCALGDGVIEHVARLKTLETASFFDTAVSERGIKKLKAKRPDLQISYETNKGE